jgi:hypothetical protein
MTNLDELIYSYKYIKGMIKRIEKDLNDDVYDNLTPSEIYSKEADLHGLHKTMGELYRKISVIKKKAIKATLVKATITTNNIDTFIFDKSIRHDNNIVELTNRIIGKFTFNILGAEIVKEGEYLLSFDDDYIKSGKVFISIKNDTNYIVTIPEDTRWFFIDDVAKDKSEEFRNNIKE